MGQPVEKSLGFSLRRNWQTDTMQYPLGAVLWEHRSPLAKLKKRKYLQTEWIRRRLAPSLKFGVPGGVLCRKNAPIQNVQVKHAEE